MSARFSSRALIVSLALAIVAGCRVGSGAGPDRGGNQLVAPAPMPQDPLETIARYEDARSDGDGLLQALLQKGSAKTRERAAIALGRLDASTFGSAVTDGLEAALGDESSSVRAAAAFALGERGDVAAASTLLAHWNDSDAAVRARIVEAGSRLDDERLRAKILDSLDDPSPLVRCMAALAPARFGTKLADSAAADDALVAFLARTDASKKPAPDVEQRWRALFALARRKSERARSAFVRASNSSDVRERIYAAQGLGAIATDEASRRVLMHALTDSDWRVACEAAVALGRSANTDSLSALATATEHPSAHVRRCAFEALAHFSADKEQVRPFLERARVDASPNVRAASIEAGATLFGDAVAPALALAAMERDPLVRAGAAAGAAHFTSSTAVPMLDTLSRDPNLRVAGIAIEGLAQHKTPAAHARLCELLRADDNGLRLAAVTSLRETPIGSDVDALRACLESSQGEIAAEIAAGIMESAAKIGGDGGLALLRLGLAHPDPFVRKVARKLVASTYPSVELPRAKQSSVRTAAVPIAGKDASAWTANPRVEIKTSRGALVFELFPDEAPGHVFNFLALVDRHHYDGLVFHRVVPDFVIQGGDHRGDGNGAVTWRGEPLRSEFTPRAFVRGSLGMPRNDDPDSGGSQFFVTHRETPHLDGRYTIFGELRSGFEVLDAIEVGDVIESVALLPAK